MDKFKSTKPFRIELFFNHQSIDEPLFNHEVVYKTIKGLFHDLKRDYFSDAEYDLYGPIYLYEIKRGSEWWTFLADEEPLRILFYALGLYGIYKDWTIKDIDILSRQLDIIQKNFPNATPESVKRFLSAVTPFGRRKIINQLMDQGLYKVRISEAQGKDNPDVSIVNMVEIEIQNPPQSEE